jgi:hypothetical protein
MVPTRRIEDRMRKLCERASQAEGEELEAIVTELQITIHEYLRRMGNNMLAGVLRFPKIPEERRKP